MHFDINDFKVSARLVNARTLFDGSIDPCPQIPDIIWDVPAPPNIEGDPREYIESEAFRFATAGEFSSAYEFFGALPEEEGMFDNAEVESAFFSRKERELEAAKCRFSELLSLWEQLITEDGFSAGWVKKSSILNLTQHAATTDQVEAGVVEPSEKVAVQAVLTFDSIPTSNEMAERAEFLARIAVDSGCKKAMIGGAPFFMAPLERALMAAGITPVYAFSVRDSVEQPDGNGGVRKINVFRHVGFVEAAQ